MKKILLTILLAVGLSSPAWAVFPTTRILDSFNRANENPLSSAQWGQNGPNQMQIVSNQAVGTVSGSVLNGAYINTGTYTSPEVYVTIATILSTTNDTFSISADYDHSTGFGYSVQYFRNTGTHDSLTLSVKSSGGTTSLGSVTQNFTANDGLGLSAIAGQVIVWYRSGLAGTWTALITVSDSTITSGGIAMICKYATTSPGITNFGGGQVVTVNQGLEVNAATLGGRNSLGMFPSGGTITFTPTITSFNGTATSPSGTLTTSDSCITITAGTQTFGSSILSGASASATSPFSFSISSGCPTGHLVAMSLVLSNSGFTGQSLPLDFYVNVPYPKVTAPSYTCTTNYYDSSNGQDGAVGTSIGTSWATQQNAISTIQGISNTQPNVCVNSYPGTYIVTGGNSFTPGNFGDQLGGDATGDLVFRAIVPFMTVIQVPYSANFNTSGASGFIFDRANYMTFDGFVNLGILPTATPPTLNITVSNGYSFTIPSSTITTGAIYSNNGNNYTVILGGSNLTKISTTSSGGAPLSTGTLTKVSGTGPSTIAYTASATITGMITGGTIATGGLGLIAGEKIGALQTNAGFGIFTVPTVDGSGAATSLTAYSVGNAYTAANGVSTSILSYENGFAFNGPPSSGVTTGGSHITVINNIVANHGGAGISAVHTDYFKVLSNIISNTAGYDPFETSAISDYQAAKSDSMAGFHNNISNNVIFNNSEISDGHANHSDGNAIILDDFHNSQNGSPYPNYDQTSLSENNLCISNGGGCVHIFVSDNITVRNNTGYNDYNDLLNTGVSGIKAEFNTNGGINDTFVNNIGYMIPIPNTSTSANTACADANFSGSNTGNTWNNNVCYAGLGNPATYTLSTNAVIDATTVNFVGINPNFNNISNFDFTIPSPGYPEKSTGTLLSYPVTDLVGNTVFPNNLTIGAYQFQSNVMSGSVRY